MAEQQRESTLVLKIEDLISEPSEKVANALESQREEIEKLYVAQGNLQKQLRSIKGSDEESKKLQGELKQKYREVTEAISDRQKAMAKEGVSFDQLTTRVRKLRTEEEKLAKAEKEEAKARGDADKKAKAASEKAARQAKKDENEAKKLKLLQRQNIQAALNSFGGGGGLGKIAGEANGLKDLLAAGAEGGSLMAMGMAAAAAGVVALGVGIAKASYELGKWIVLSGQQLRDEKLQRQAWLAGAADADRLGDHIANIARTVPLAREEINKLAIGLLKADIGGQTMVSTLEALAHAESALGPEAAGKFQEMITRGRLTGRFHVAPLELVGTSLSLKDISKALSQEMGIGIQEAQDRLLSGRVKLETGAKALARAVKAGVGDINLEKNLNLDTMLMKAQENLTALTKDVNLKPLLEGFSSLAKMLDTSTVSGKILKGIVTSVGNTMTSWVGGALTDVSEGIKEWIAFFLDVDTKILSVGNHIKDVIDKAAKLTGTTEQVKKIGDAISNGASTAGKSALSATADAMTDGLLMAFGGAQVVLFKRGMQMAKAVDMGFRSEAEIHSPSRKMEQNGLMLTEGLTQGMDKGAPEVKDTSRELFQLPAKGDIQNVANNSTTNTSSESSSKFIVNFNINGNEKPQAVISAIKSINVVDQLRLASLSMGRAPQGA